MFRDGGVQTFYFDSVGEISRIYGQSTSGADLLIYGTSNHANPVIQFDGDNQNISINATTALSAHFDLALRGDGVLCMIEGATPTADAGYGKLYTKNDNKLYFQSGDGVEHEVAYV